MSAISRTLVSGIRCDMRGCCATVEGPERDGYRAGHYFEALAATRGWTLYRGRSRANRCPAHPVKPYTGMASQYRQTAELMSPVDRYCRDDDCPCKTLPQED